MDQPRISIVTPSYNQGEFLEDTILSVKNQSYSNVEHLVIDGGSDDNTQNILEKYENKYNLTWISEPDDGQSDAINKGFQRASGDIIAWINSDDVYFDVNTFNRVARYFANYSEDIIYGDLVHINKNSKIEAVDPHPQFDRSKLFYRVLLGQPATFFRKKVVKRNKVRTDLHYCMDYEYWLRLSQKYDFRHVDDILSGFRVYPEQKSQDSDSMFNEFNQMISNYERPTQHPYNIAFENGVTELRRWVRSLFLIRQLHNNPPQLAFDGSYATRKSMILNIPPDMDDVIKVWYRLREKKESN